MAKSVLASTSILGKVFGRLLVVAYAGCGRYWCRCACGNRKSVHRGNLQNGHCQSCGCLAREKTVCRNTSHGQSNSPEWKAWHEMKRRCYDPSRHNYRYYGGRGIRVCRRWLTSFAAFLADLGNKPSTSYTLDRIDRDKDYEPGNCCWATRQTQSQNRTVTQWVTCYGKTFCLREWFRRLGIPPTTLAKRLARGLTAEQALTTPAVKWREVLTGPGDPRLEGNDPRIGGGQDGATQL